jgi:hypothetical protein
MLSSLLNVGLLFLLVLPPTIDSHKQTKPEKAAASSQHLLKCEDAKVRYAPFDEAYSKRMVLKSVTDSEDPPQSVPKEYSPERNMWQAEVDPDTTKPGPWSTSVYFGSDANEDVWKLTFVDAIGAGGLHWLNEKLVYGEVFWGRIYATEFILDLQQHKFIYREMADYGAMTEPCQ